MEGNFKFRCCKYFILLIFITAKSDELIIRAFPFDIEKNDRFVDSFREKNDNKLIPGNLRGRTLFPKDIQDRISEIECNINKGFYFVYMGKYIILYHECYMVRIFAFEKINEEFARFTRGNVYSFPNERWGKLPDQINQMIKQIEPNLTSKTISAESPYGNGNIILKYKTGDNYCMIEDQIHAINESTKGILEKLLRYGKWE